MKLAASNIGWQPHEDAAVANLMREYGVTGVEIAPTKIWKNPLSVSESDIRTYKAKWNRLGIHVVSMQALLFGRPELTIFEDKSKRQQTLSYLTEIIRLGGLLGVSVLVFGSPKNRSVASLPKPIVDEIASEFFTSVGNIATEHGCVFCIEPNPKVYGCDFITDSEQARRLVSSIDHPGFGLHLDAAGMTLSEEDIGTQLTLSLPGLCHFHISEKDLLPIGSGTVDHRTFADIFRSQTYGGWHSIEMRAQETGSNLPAVASAFNYVHQTYQR